MKIAIVSDVQGNLPAFTSVLKHIDEQGADIKISLGNTVGLYPYPDECISLTVLNFNYIMRGRSDMALLDADNILAFNPVEKEAAEWTRKNTSKGSVDVVGSLLEYASTEGGYLLFVNGSPNNIRQTISNLSDALTSFANPIVPFEMAFVGGTGISCVWQETEKKEIVRRKIAYDNSLVSSVSYNLEEGSRFIVNVGSVGAPKDNDPRSSYAIFDTETKKLTFYKVPYSIDKTVGKMQQKGFSTNSYLRLMYGK